MDQAKMAHSTDQQDSSDDLIAELARLMAEDALGPEREGERAAAAAPSQSRPSERMNHLNGENIVRIPGRSAAETPEVAALSTEPEIPDDLADLLSEDNYPPANTAAPTMSRTSPPADDSAQASVPLPEAPLAQGKDSFSSEPLAESIAGRSNLENKVPDYSQIQEKDLRAAALRGNSHEAKDSRNLAEMPGGAESRRDYAELDPEEIDPIAALIAAQESDTSPEPRTAQAFRMQAEEPRSKSEHHRSVAQDPQIYEDATEPAPEPVRVPKRSVVPQNAGTNAAAGGADSFVTPPVFGLPGRTQQRRPSSPLDEIESLIGDAVKVGVESRQTSRAPGLNEQDGVAGAADAAEAAIMAATEATGRPVRRFEPEMAEESAMRSTHRQSFDLDRDEPLQMPRRRNGWAAPLVAALLLISGGIGVYWVFGLNGGDTSSIPFLVSNTDNAKVAAEISVASAEPESVVFSQLDGASEEAPAETLVSRDQSAVDDAALDGVRQVEVSDATNTGLANRKVRTVTVRPDGTIVAGDDIVAANEVLPIDRPNVPALSSVDAAVAENFVVASEFTEQPIIADPAAVAAASNAESIVTAAIEPIDATATESATTGLVDPLSDLIDANTAPVPLPMPRPANRMVASISQPEPLVLETTQPAVAAPATTNAVDLIAGEANQVALSLPAATVAPASPSVGDVAAAAYVQLASQRTEDAARASLSTVNRQFSSLISGKKTFVRPVDLGDRGVFYRVLVPAASLQEANSICADIKTAGGDCFVRSD